MTGTILVTGATGNVGREVVNALLQRDQPLRAAVINEADAAHVPGTDTPTARFDFGDPGTYEAAFRDVDRLFLMRPPAIADVERYLFPVVDYARAAGIRQIAFLSLMGVENNKRVPHYAVEQYIMQSGVPYTFVRPSFYMQNLNTVYRESIRDNDEIYLPAGRGKTAFIDVRDIGAVTALALSETGHENKAYAITGDDALDYFEIAKVLSEVLGRDIRYPKPTMPAYLMRLRKQGVPADYIKVQRMLYTPVRLGLAAETTDELARLLGRPPISFRQYAEDYAGYWQ